MSNRILSVGILVLVSLLCSCERTEKVSVISSSASKDEKLAPPFNEEHPQFSGENAYNRVDYLVSLGERQTESKGLEESIQFMERELARFGWKTQRQTFAEETEWGRKTFTNLRARLAGEADFSLPASGVIGCHIDTKVMPFPFVAANDGASHTAVLLEFARLMGREPGRWKGVELVFFDGEECFGERMDPDGDGLYGSRFYVNSLEEKYPQWMVNLDMLGARRLKIAIPLETDQRLFQLYRETIGELNESEEVFGVASFPILDDHYPFYLKGIPTINFIADFSEGGWWHTPKDNMDLISIESLQRSGDLIWRYLSKLPLPEKGE